MLLLRMNRILLSVLTIKMLLLLCYLCMSCLVAFASRFWGDAIISARLNLFSIYK